MADPLFRATDLTVKYETASGWITGVSDANFTIEEGEYFGLVGESGCGKSTIAKSIIGGLDSNGEVTSGTIEYRGREIQDLSQKELNESIRWDEISYIPQSSMNSLDPLERVQDQAVEIAQTHTDMSVQEAVDRFKEMFEVVGIPESRITDYPHQFSGGMAQRAVIALALFLNPSLIIADEPTTALDVIMQDQIFKYYDKIREDMDTSMLLITHDISLVFESCDSMAVMHGGQVAESGAVTDIYDNPHHPYSVLLQLAFPDLESPDRELEVIEGKPPRPAETVDYCTFADRCPLAIEDCRRVAPELEAVDGEEASGKQHSAACIRMDNIEQLKEERKKGAIQNHE